MGHALVRPACYEDLLDLPERLVGEIIGGRLVTHPRPTPRHARAHTRLGAELDGPFDQGRGGPGGWWILDEPEIHIDADILVPDLAGWRRERLPSLPQTAWFEQAPDWVCEVLSPSTARVDRVEKLPPNARCGVGHAWLVDPELRTLEAYANGEERWVLLATLKDDDPAALPPFAAVTFSLAGLWPD